MSEAPRTTSQLEKLIHVPELFEVGIEYGPIRDVLLDVVSKVDALLSKTNKLANNDNQTIQPEEIRQLSQRIDGIAAANKQQNSDFNTEVRELKAFFQFQLKDIRDKYDRHLTKLSNSISNPDSPRTEPAIEYISDDSRYDGLSRQVEGLTARFENMMKMVNSTGFGRQVATVPNQNNDVPKIQPITFDSPTKQVDSGIASPGLEIDISKAHIDASMDMDAPIKIQEKCTSQPVSPTSKPIVDILTIPGGGKAKKDPRVDDLVLQVKQMTSDIKNHNDKMNKAVLTINNLIKEVDKQGKDVVCFRNEVQNRNDEFDRIYDKMAEISVDVEKKLVDFVRKQSEKEEIRPSQAEFGKTATPGSIRSLDGALEGIRNDFKDNLDVVDTNFRSQVHYLKQEVSQLKAAIKKLGGSIKEIAEPDYAPLPKKTITPLMSDSNVERNLNPNSSLLGGEQDVIDSSRSLSVVQDAKRNKKSASSSIIASGAGGSAGGKRTSSKKDKGQTSRPVSSNKSSDQITGKHGKLSKTMPAGGGNYDQTEAEVRAMNDYESVACQTVDNRVPLRRFNASSPNGSVPNSIETVEIGYFELPSLGAESALPPGPVLYSRHNSNTNSQSSIGQNQRTNSAHSSFPNNNENCSNSSNNNNNSSQNNLSDANSNDNINDNTGFENQQNIDKRSQESLKGSNNSRNASNQHLNSALDTSANRSQASMKSGENDSLINAGLPSEEDLIFENYGHGDITPLDPLKQQQANTNDPNQQSTQVVVVKKNKNNNAVSKPKSLEFSFEHLLNLNIFNDAASHAIVEALVNTARNIPSSSRDGPNTNQNVSQQMSPNGSKPSTPISNGGFQTLQGQENSQNSTNYNESTKNAEEDTTGLKNDQNQNADMPSVDVNSIMQQILQSQSNQTADKYKVTLDIHQRQIIELQKHVENLIEEQQNLAQALSSSSKQSTSTTGTRSKTPFQVSPRPKVNKYSSSSGKRDTISRGSHPTSQPQTPQQQQQQQQQVSQQHQQQQGNNLPKVVTDDGPNSPTSPTITSPNPVKSGIFTGTPMHNTPVETPHQSPKHSNISKGPGSVTATVPPRSKSSGEYEDLNNNSNNNSKSNNNDNKFPSEPRIVISVIGPGDQNRYTHKVLADNPGDPSLFMNMTSSNNNNNSGALPNFSSEELITFRNRLFELEKSFGSLTRQVSALQTPKGSRPRTTSSTSPTPDYISANNIGSHSTKLDSSRKNDPNSKSAVATRSYRIIKPVAQVNLNPTITLSMSALPSLAAHQQQQQSLSNDPIIDVPPHPSVKFVDSNGKMMGSDEEDEQLLQHKLYCDDQFRIIREAINNMRTDIQQMKMKENGAYVLPVPDVNGAQNGSEGDDPDAKKNSDSQADSAITEENPSLRALRRRLDSTTRELEDQISNLRRELYVCMSKITSQPPTVHSSRAESGRRRSEGDSARSTDDASGSTNRDKKANKKGKNGELPDVADIGNEAVDFLKNKFFEDIDSPRIIKMKNYKFLEPPEVKRMHSKNKNNRSQPNIDIASSNPASTNLPLLPPSLAKSKNKKGNMAGIKASNSEPKLPNANNLGSMANIIFDGTDARPPVSSPTGGNGDEGGRFLGRTIPQLVKEVNVTNAEPSREIVNAVLPLIVELRSDLQMKVERAMEHARMAEEMMMNKVDKEFVNDFFRKMRQKIIDLKTEVDEVKNTVPDRVTHEELNNLATNIYNTVQKDQTATAGTVSYKCLFCGATKQKVSGMITDRNVVEALGDPQQARAANNPTMLFGSDKQCYKGRGNYGRTGIASKLESRRVPPLRATTAVPVKSD